MSVMALLVTLYVLCILVPINAGTLCKVGVAYDVDNSNSSHFLGRSNRDDSNFERTQASVLDCSS